VKATRYSGEQVRRKRPYIDMTVCAAVVAAPLRTLVQPDGRVRQWAEVVDARDGKARILRVVTLENRETGHKAFFDGDFVKDEP
jgi:hypothetical protein